MSNYPYEPLINAVLYQGSGWEYQSPSTHEYDDEDGTYVQYEHEQFGLIGIDFKTGDFTWWSNEFEEWSQFVVPTLYKLYRTVREISRLYGHSYEGEDDEDLLD